MSDVQIRTLTAFWTRWRKGAPKIDLLREFARFQFDGRQTREAFEASGIRLKRDCRVCGDVANHRHHIIQLRKGGMNAPKNIIALCRFCHALVHRQVRRQRIGVLHKSRELGPPRLVSSAHHACKDMVPVSSPLPKATEPASHLAHASAGPN